MCACVCDMTLYPPEATRLWRIPQPPPALTEFQTGQDVFALLPNGQWAKAKVIGVEASAYIIEYVTVKGSGAEAIPFGAAGTQLKPMPSGWAQAAGVPREGSAGHPRHPHRSFTQLCTHAMPPTHAFLSIAYRARCERATVHCSAALHGRLPRHRRPNATI